MHIISGPQKSLVHHLCATCILANRVYSQALAMQLVEGRRSLNLSYPLQMDDINLIVFDECHHCKMADPYNKIMQDFYFGMGVPVRQRLCACMRASPVPCLLWVCKQIALWSCCLSQICVNQFWWASVTLLWCVVHKRTSWSLKLAYYALEVHSYALLSR